MGTSSLIVVAATESPKVDSFTFTLRLVELLATTASTAPKPALKSKSKLIACFILKTEYWVAPWYSPTDHRNRALSGTLPIQPWYCYRFDPLAAGLLCIHSEKVSHLVLATGSLVSDWRTLWVLPSGFKVVQARAIWLALSFWGSHCELCIAVRLWAIHG